jgi:hypothetical protein
MLDRCLTIGELLLRMDQRYRSALERPRMDHGERFRSARESSHSNQDLAAVSTERQAITVIVPTA